MSITINTKTFTTDTSNGNKVTYIGPAKTVSVKDDFSLNRIPPKATSVMSGVGKCTAKLTRTLSLTGALTPSWDAIVTIDISVPVGFTAADVDALLNDAGSFLSGADAKTFVKTQKINF